MAEVVEGKWRVVQSTPSTHLYAMNHPAGVSATLVIVQMRERRISSASCHSCGPASPLPGCEHVKAVLRALRDGTVL